ncbi:neuraminidase-like domain-containing protein [Tardiphaga sp.]|uniref:Tc toxin subunit A-related protein n=1 Tax=Tardiphaga sp. TaxID=1926292 RepID=UPI00263479FE|nr:neuraminidase-like domain-containing protein [Tardiphaga sp.]MDB5616720.1 hypothetical protein [Tardiphaga sp.]
MASSNSKLQTRIRSLRGVLSGKVFNAVSAALEASNGDWTAARASVAETLAPEQLQKADLAHSLADLTNDDVSLVTKIAKQANVTSFRDLALNYDVDKLAALIAPPDDKDTTADSAMAAKATAVTLNNRLFSVQTSAALQRMIQASEIPIADADVRTGVLQFFNAKPDFNIRQTSIYTALQDSDALASVAADKRTGVIEQLKTLQRVQALSPTGEAVPVLLKANLTSAFQISEMPESTFMNAHKEALGEDSAQRVYTYAIDARVRNENALMTMQEAARGSGMKILDNDYADASLDDKKKIFAGILNKHAVPLNLETLFGSMDYCACDDCQSVYSPAAYFVELMQYLRNNDLGPDPKSDDPDPTHNPNIHKGFANTPLAMLYRRRPDIFCLDLTCENTNTVLPYIDLVNEVMESFVVHLGKYHADTHVPKQATLEVFDVIDETSEELLAQPQHINYEAYCILKSAVYPFSLPYHQPIDAARILLDYMGTSRFELLDTYRTASESGSGQGLPPAQQQELQALHPAVLDRSADAEFLRMTQEEYIILTRQAFWPKRYFELTQSQTLTDDIYSQKIGVKPVCEYYGYGSSTEMLSTDETRQAGLTFVKKQFLPRTGIQYSDLVDLLLTRSINPNYPQGLALTIMESLRLSYRFMQTLVDNSSSDPRIRYAKLIEWLEATDDVLPLLKAFLHPDPCHKMKSDCCGDEQRAKELARWVYCYFERVGQLIVLETGDGPQLNVYGHLYKRAEGGWTEIGMLSADGSITDNDGKIIGQVGQDLKIALKDDGTNVLFKGEVFVRDFGAPVIGAVIDYALYDYLHEGRSLARWLPTRDSCDLNKVRLAHLDGTALTEDEYDRIQRFIRLWRKMGWTIDEADKALNGFVEPPADALGASYSGAAPYVSFAAFKDDCADTPDNGDEDCCCDDGGTLECPDERAVDFDITPEFIHQLAAIKKLLDLTGLPLLKLLTFWADISTAGSGSLYAKLFLTHNIQGLDKVFAADANGNFLTQPAKISDHLPVLMAALSLKAGDVQAIMAQRRLRDSLTLANVSALYRHGLIAKLLHVKVTDLVNVFALFGDPFVDAASTVVLFDVWGKMEDAGFKFQQLDYVIREIDDPLRPQAPSPKKALQLAKIIYDGLTGIDKDQPDIPQDKPETATNDVVRAKAGLIFDQTVVEGIVGLINGTTVYSTNAPVNLTLTIPAALAAKLKYSNQPTATPSSAGIQVTGLLTANEAMQAKSLVPGNVDWGKAIDRAAKQAEHFYDDVLFGIFADKAAAKAILLAGDVTVPADQIDPTLPDPNTAPIKRLYFLRCFMPFLRERLAHKLIVDTMSGATGLAADVTDTLLSKVLTVGTPPLDAMTSLENIKNIPPSTPGIWKGYLIPPTSDSYTFAVTSDTAPAPLVLDGQAISFPHQQDDPSNVWSSDPVLLKSGKLYYLQVTGVALSQLAWKTAISPKMTIPGSALLPDDSMKGTGEAFAKIFKAAILVNGFNLTEDEVEYFHAHSTDFDDFDFNSVKLKHWKRLQAYTKLRDSLPQLDTKLLDLFGWAVNPDDPTKLGAKIAAVATWDETSVSHLLTPAHFDVGTPADFRNEINLVTLQKALAIASKTNMNVDSLFGWADPNSQFWPCHKIAEDIRKALRSRFDAEDWEQVIKPLNDTQRENQKNALIAYLLVQQDLIDWAADRGEILDADTLFEFFLIDVQMCACMETSRIKQAISTVQLFVQRCMLGLESPYVPNDALDRDRWTWMEKFVLWQANRKVFLYPENWIKTELRDDKSIFYKELESELLQKDITPQSVDSALQNYLFKVDEVANLTIVGLYVESDRDGNQAKIHIFGRTRNAPYLFYYRYYEVYADNWYPWGKMTVDIPSYDVEQADSGIVTGHGSYLTPVVTNGRLLVFFPQFVKKTAANKKNSGETIQKHAGETPASTAPYIYWEIKIGWTELRNGKWTPKQVSSDSFPDDPNGNDPPSPPHPVPDISQYEFLPRVVNQIGAQVHVDVYYGGFETAKKRFTFSGSQLFGESNSPPAIAASDRTSTTFHFTQSNTQMHSLQAVGAEDPPLLAKQPYFDVEPASVTVSGEGKARSFNHTFVDELLGELARGGLDDLYAYYAGITNQNTTDDAYGADLEVGFHELRRPYALYNWEVGLHAPMAIVAKLLAGQQFDQALEMCHYVFDPSAKGAEASRFWQFPPFKQIDAMNVLERLFLSLQPGVPNKAINEWRDNPFQPHVVARSRPSAYMKWVVMQYVQILIAYGDYYFRQNSLEAIPMAIQCYVLASHIYGPKGQVIPKRGKILPETYLSLLDKWDAFGNAMVELELAFPFSNQISNPTGASNGVVGIPNVFGFATSLYFCIPPNPNLQALRDTIDDRLFKIRHCEDINGVFRQLPLFDAPIDPGLLVAAAAAGLSLSSVLNDLNSPMPNYRFNYLVQKAIELCGELKGLGNAFLSAKEKADAEALTKLRATHESSIANLVMELRKQQLDEANKTLESLQQNRKGPVYRLQHALKLIGEDLAKVPADVDTDFAELPDMIEAPVSDSGMKLMSLEKEELDKAGIASDQQDAVTQMETLGSVMSIIPNFGASFQPLGCGGTISFGGSNLGAAFQAMARSAQGTVSKRTYESTSAGRKGGFLRQLQDRVLQANTAGYEIKGIDKQILTQQIRINIAGQEITNQQKQIDNAQEVEDFLRNKYTNEELYSWMQDSVRGLYYQAYTLAYDIAKRAEQVFRFERQTDSNFIQFGYWDASHDGLLAGERLYIGLKQLEAAYQSERGYDFEVVKEISLKQVDPLALLQLRQTGVCEFAVPEVLFDMDLPGQYMRRIRSVAVTVPCVIGPYTSLNCTLRLREHKFRSSAIVKDKSDYPQRTDENDERFSTVNIPITAIAVSKGQSDSGLFELNFRDERYSPFEGAGAISKWSLELPSQFRQFDYDTISDVVLTMRYTSKDGGDKLKKSASDSVLAYIKSVEDLSRDEGLYAAFDLKHDFPNEWYKATQPMGGPAIVLKGIYERLPIFTKGRKAAKISANDVYVFAGEDSGVTGVTLTERGNDTLLVRSAAVGDLISFDAENTRGVPMDDWTLTFQGNKLNLDRLWLVVRYVLS